MTIKSIVIEGVEGDIEITRNDCGAYVMDANLCIARISRDDTREFRYEQAKVVAAAVYGTDKRGRPAATNSMVHDVLQEMEHVAGC